MDDLPGPFPVGRYARKLEEEMRRRARVSLIGEVTGLSRSKAQAYFELRDGEGPFRARSGSTSWRSSTFPRAVSATAPKW